jgi:hypothetical protein
MHGCKVTLKFKEAELLESVSPCCDSEVEYGNVYFMLMIPTSDTGHINQPMIILPRRACPSWVPIRSPP